MTCRAGNRLAQEVPNGPRNGADTCSHINLHKAISKINQRSGSSLSHNSKKLGLDLVYTGHLPCQAKNGKKMAGRAVSCGGGGSVTAKQLDSAQPRASAGGYFGLLGRGCSVVPQFVRGQTGGLEDGDGWRGSTDTEGADGALVHHAHDALRPSH